MFKEGNFQAGPVQPVKSGLPEQLAPSAQLNLFNGLDELAKQDSELRGILEGRAGWATVGHLGPVPDAATISLIGGCLDRIFDVAVPEAKEGIARLIKGVNKLLGGFPDVAPRSS